MGTISEFLLKFSKKNQFGRDRTLKLMKINRYDSLASLNKI
jgi:hypothetical protein